MAMKYYRMLSILFIALFTSSALFAGVGLVVTPEDAMDIRDQGDIPTAYPSEDIDLRNSPVSMLVYTEFCDTTTAAPYNEFRNTMDAILNTFGEEFTYDNLTSFSQLSSLINDYHILLLPEQENLDATNLTLIANSWTAPLTSFVNNGGIVIATDCNAVGLLEAGPTMQILNETGLMSVFNANDGFAWTNNLVAPNDALARNVASSWSAPDGSVYFDTTDATVVVDDGTHAVVAHKIMGKGHVVLLGFDLWTTEINSETLLANAIRLHSHVVFDASHDNLETVQYGYTTFANDLATNGFAVSGMTSFDEDLINSADVLVISAADYHGVAEYTTQELDIIQTFVSNGGGLFITSDYGPFGNVTDPVNERFGFFRNKTSVLYDSDNYNAAGSGYSVIYSGSENIVNHSATLQVSTLETWAGTGLESWPTGTVPLVVTDIDGTSTYDSFIPADGVRFSAATTYGKGRVIFVGDSNLFDDSDLDGDLTIDYYDQSSEYFARGCISWLSAAGLEEKIVLFDQSKDPNFTINLSLHYVANLLTRNGYTIKWMTDFLPDLLSVADILFILDGTTNYNGSEINQITAFVSNGGSLYLTGCYGQYIQQVVPIGEAFGFGLGSDEYLEDTDDSIGLPSYIVYTGSNLRNHPILSGISRVELYLSGTIDVSGASATSLITTDADGTSDYSGGAPADGLTIMAATTYNKGRLFYSADYVNLRADLDTDGDGIHSLYDSDNALLVLNIFRWLTENRAPSVAVTYPNGGEVLNGTQTITWNAADLDGDSLSFDLWYSDNNGTDWNVLTTGVTSHSYAWNTTVYDDGTGYMIRVRAFDGQLQTFDESDNPFELDNVQPTGGTLFPIDPMLLLAILGIVVVIIVVVYIYNRRRGAST